MDVLLKHPGTRSDLDDHRPKRSTAWPLVRTRASGSRSTSVTANPCRQSQYAAVGPARLAPEIRTRKGCLGMSPTHVSGVTVRCARARASLSIALIRAAARDLVDVAALAERYTLEQLCELATEKDAGFDRRVLADPLNAAAAPSDAAFAELGLEPEGDPLPPSGQRRDASPTGLTRLSCRAGGAQAPCKLVIAEQEVWVTAKVGTLAECPCGPVMQISVMQDPEQPWAEDFKIICAPHMAPHMVSIGP